MQSESKPRKRVVQFTLRALAVAMLVISLAVCWFAARMHRARQQRRVVAALEQKGVAVMYDFQFDENDDVDFESDMPGPRWLRDLVGKDVFREVIYVDYAGGDVTDDDLQVLQQLPGIRWVCLNNTGLSDEVVMHLQLLKRLENVELGQTTLSKDAVSKLQRALPNCTVTP